MELNLDRAKPAANKGLGHETRNAILDAAEAPVAREGVASLTFDLLAKAAKVSRGGVLYHYASKEARQPGKEGRNDRRPRPAGTARHPL